MDQADALRTLMNKNKAPGLKVITVTSAKGGVGKSSIALNLAIALCKRGKRTLIVDMDVGLANIDVMLGVRPKYDLVSVIQNDADIREAIESGQNGVKFISAGSGFDELFHMDAPQLQSLLNTLLTLDDIIDIIIFDTGAGISESIIKLICASHETLLITTPEPTAIMDAYAMVKIASKEPIKPNIQLIINKADNAREAKASSTGFVTIAEKYTGMKIGELGYILTDDNMTKAVKLQIPLLLSYPKCQASASIETLADRYMTQAANVKTGISGFFERLIGRNINDRVLRNVTE